MKSVRALGLGLMLLTCAAAAAPHQHDDHGSPQFKAVAFDYLALFNPDSILPEVEREFPGHGSTLIELWRNRQFEYSWLRSITGRYVGFQVVTEDALVYAAHALNLELTREGTKRLLEAYLRLEPWPDTLNTLRTLKESRVHVIAVANFSPLMLRANAENAGLSLFFDALVSTDAVRRYKPDPLAYQLGANRLHLAKSEILFAAFGGWDAAGAKSFGYPTVWVNRFNQPMEQLGVKPDGTCSNLDCVLEFVLKNRSGR
jgi:2-haloacid dehalogenase